MNSLINIDISNKRVLVRLDTDVPIVEGVVADDTRLQNACSTLEFLTKHSQSVTVIGHLGRPQGRVEPALSLKPVQAWIQRRFPQVHVWENVRFDPREEANDLTLAYDIVRRSQAHVYMFDAFAVSHREHASVVGIPKLLPTVLGFRMRDELLALGKVLQTSRRPFVVVLGGAKPETKLPFVLRLLTVADTIFLGGTLPQALHTHRELVDNLKVHVATLTPEGLDISPESAAEFSQAIMSAGTVVWNGPVGAFEKGSKLKTQNSKLNFDRQAVENQLKDTPAWGTYVIAKAVSSTPAYTVVGGGDTEVALTRFGLEFGIDWISSGGGAMLHFLAYRTLPFLEAVGERRP